MADARTVHNAFRDLRGTVGLVVTSPPYLDTTNFEEDQWLRLWFLGGAASPSGVARNDHRHFSATTYCSFLAEAWRGLAPLLRRDSHVIVRIGGPKINFENAEQWLAESLKRGMDRPIRLVEKSFSEIRGGQHQSFRPALTATRSEFDFHWLVH